MKVLILLGTAVLLKFSASPALADDGVPGFTCKNKVVVQYVPGPRWSELEQVLPKHLDFMATQMKDGNIDFGGPLVSESGDPTGGLAIYNVSEVKQVETLTQLDPLVSEGVSTFSVRAWVQCVVK